MIRSPLTTLRVKAVAALLPTVAAIVVVSAWAIEQPDELLLPGTQQAGAPPAGEEAGNSSAFDLAPFERAVWGASVESDAPEVAAEKSVVRQSPLSWTLVGLTFTPEKQVRAVFYSEETCEIAKVAEGAHLDDWLIESVLEDSVTLRHVHDITLLRIDPKTGQTTVTLAEAQAGEQVDE